MNHYHLYHSLFDSADASQMQLLILIKNFEYKLHHNRFIEDNENIPGLFGGVLTNMEYLLSAGGIPRDLDIRFFNGLPLLDLLALVKLENAEKCDPLLVRFSNSAKS